MLHRIFLRCETEDYVIFLYGRLYAVFTPKKMFCNFYKVAVVLFCRRRQFGTARRLYKKKTPYIFLSRFPSGFGVYLTENYVEEFFFSFLERLTYPNRSFRRSSSPPLHARVRYYEIHAYAFECWRFSSFDSRELRDCMA